MQISGAPVIYARSPLAPEFNHDGCDICLGLKTVREWVEATGRDDSFVFFDAVEDVVFGTISFYSCRKCRRRVNLRAAPVTLDPVEQQRILVDSLYRPTESMAGDDDWDADTDVWDGEPTQAGVPVPTSRDSQDFCGGLADPGCRSGVRVRYVKR